MEKNFDKWNIQKKEIHLDGENRFYKPREVWWCYLGINVGFEQDGTGDKNQRPVLIIKGFSKNVCLILPLTKSTKKNRYHINIGKINKIESFAIISQIKLIDTKRLINKIGFLNKDIFEKTKKAIRELI